MCLADVLRGVRATRETSFRLSNGTEVRCAVRVLHPDLETSAIQDDAARRAALEGAAGREGDPCYDRWVRVLTVLRGVVDPDGDPPEPFFDGGAEQLLRRLDDGQIRRLFEAQSAWQRECRPPPGKQRVSELLGVTDPKQVHHFVIAARYAKGPAEFFGQPGVTLTRDQVWIWQDLVGEHYDRFEKK